MQMQEAVKTCFQKYATVQGRASRSEYWFWVLFVVICSLILGVLDGALFGIDPVTHQPNGIFRLIFSLATLVPHICVATRRLHDLDKSGWWQLINFIPIVGWIIFIVWAASKGTAGSNRFGADPLGGTMAS